MTLLGRLLGRFVVDVETQKAAPVAHERECVEIASAGQRDAYSLDPRWTRPSAVPPADGAGDFLIELTEAGEIVRDAETDGERWAASRRWIFVPLHRTTLSRRESAVKP
jgi:hypothetical protein